MSAKSSLFPRTVLVTGAAGGIGRAIVERLEQEGAEVTGLDLKDGFDVTDPAAWDSVGRFDLACLNAGVTTGTATIAELTDEEYRRVVAVNVDGVLFGVRQLARVMGQGDAIVVTASLAGLTGVESDPIYALTKHAVIGLVRSVAPQLQESGIRINAVCPGFADTPMVTGEFREALECGRLSAAPGRGGRRRRAPRGAQRRNRRGVGRPAGPAAGAVPLPRHPGPQGPRRGRCRPAALAK